MKNFKLPVVLFLFCLAYVRTIAQTNERDATQPYLMKIDSINTVTRGGRLTLRIITRLVNNSDDTLKYWELNCNTKYFLYHVDFHRLKFVGGVICYSTFSVQYSLPPHAARRDTLLIQRISSNKSAIKFKLDCFIFKNFKDYDDYFLKGKPKNAIHLRPNEIIWQDKSVHIR